MKKLTKLGRFIKQEKKFKIYKKHPTISKFSGGGWGGVGGVPSEWFQGTALPQSKIYCNQ